MPQAQPTYGGGFQSSDWIIEDYDPTSYMSPIAESMYNFQTGLPGSDPNLGNFSGQSLSDILQDLDPDADNTYQKYALRAYLEQQGEATPSGGWDAYIDDHFNDLVDMITVDEDVLGDFEFKMQSNIEAAYEGMYGQSLGQEQQMAQSGFASVGSGFFDVNQFDLDEASRTLESERLGYRESTYEYHDVLGEDFWTYFNQTTGM